MPYSSSQWKFQNKLSQPDQEYNWEISVLFTNKWDRMIFRLYMLLIVGQYITPCIKAGMSYTQLHRLSCFSCSEHREQKYTRKTLASPNMHQD